MYCSKKCKNEYKRKDSKNFKTEIRKCEFCNEDFEWTEKHPNKKYCSAKCREKAESIRAKHRTYDHECLNCKKLISGKDRRKEEFCCKECEEEYKRINMLNMLDSELKENIELKNINNAKAALWDIIYLKVSEIIQKSNDNICSSIGRTLDYWKLSDIPESTKEYVLQRDNHECQICKNINNLHVHHITKRSNGGDHKTENLISLCDSCHRHIEIGDIELATKGCFQNALKYYLLENEEDHITFTNIYNDLINIRKILNNNDLNNAIYNINILLDKLEKELDYFY